MSRKNLILIVSGIILLIIVGLIIFSSSKNSSTTTQPSTKPFGDTSSDSNTSSSTKPKKDTQSTSTEKNLSQLIQIYKNPTSGSVFFVNGNKNILRFVDRAVGNIYEYLPSEQTGQARRVTNTTIPKIQEAVWSNTGNNIILRYLDNNTDNIISFSSMIKTGSSSVSNNSFGEITGQFLSQNIKQAATNPKGDKIFSIIEKSDKSGSYGYTTNLDGSSKKLIFDSPITYWNIDWPKDNTIVLTTKPSYNDVGISYLFNIQDYSMDRVLGDKYGLSVLANNDISLVAFSYSSDGSFNTSIYNTKNKINEMYYIPSLADKCVWGNLNTKILYCAVPKNVNYNNYPDVWYQGLESFSDDIWKIDTETGSISELYNIGSKESVSIDAINLTISNDDQYIALTNKDDLSLWLLKIKE